MALLLAIHGLAVATALRLTPPPKGAAAPRQQGAAAKSLFKEPDSPGVDVFSKGEHGYFCTKIPDLVVTKKGHLLAFGEARKNSCSDFAPTDLVMRRSKDHGKTWEPLKVVFGNSHKGDKGVVGNAAPVTLRSGRILLPFCKNNLKVFVAYSDDEGETWSEPRDISATTTEPSWKWVATGPPGSLELANGRILVPAYHTTAPQKLGPLDGELSKGHVMLSDDGGETWRLSKSMGNTMSFPNEGQAVQLKNNDVVLISRGLGKFRHRALSPDSGEHWETPTEIKTLTEPSATGCEGSTIICPATGALLYTGPMDWGLFRTGMYLALSTDGGKTWEKKALIRKGAAAYSSMEILRDGKLGVLYENSKKIRLVFEPDHISLMRMDLPVECSGVGKKNKGKKQNKRNMVKDKTAIKKKTSQNDDTETDTQTMDSVDDRISEKYLDGNSTLNKILDGLDADTEKMRRKTKKIMKESEELDRNAKSSRDKNMAKKKSKANNKKKHL